MRIPALLALALLGGCAGAQTAGTTARHGMAGAVAAPLYDVNLLRAKIPQVLLDAMEAPYAAPSPRSCPEIAALVRPLDEALGPDLDAAPSLDNPSVLERGGEAAGELAVDAVRGAARSIIPMRGWVRRLTGAEQHDNLVRSAINAGAIRRGYLKGLGASLRCLPPAAPQPIALEARPSGVSQPTGGPRYPIR